MSLYEWALHERKAVSFECDNGAYPLLSYASIPKVLPKQLITSSVAIYLWYCCGTTTIGLAGVAVLLIFIAIIQRPQKFEWFMINRITSATWLNRSLLLLCGVAAALVMSCTIVVPYQSNGILSFQNIPRSFIASSLLAGEATWIMYVFQEVLYPLTARATAHYARWSTATI
ncbi:hypothetical protein THRCLA_23058 [Thraustotheca clavata]|uniref:Uncharacterized protein n=1 Tax=Thraustotheca clavata TaxID=74557 RepID=A0A1V9YHC5_9STRA|nr:hypothetical protein THRCLA_23058 [Thraustotheca clavata]